MLSRSPRLGSATSPVSLQMTNFPPHFGTYKHSATSHNHCGYQISQWIYKIRFIWQDYILQDSINGYSFVFNFTLIQSMQIERQVCWGGPTNTQPAFTEAEKDLGVMNSFSGHRIWQSFKLSKFWHNYGHWDFQQKRRGLVFISATIRTKKTNFVNPDGIWISVKECQNPIGLVRRGALQNQRRPCSS